MRGRSLKCGGGMEGWSRGVEGGQEIVVIGAVKGDCRLEC